MKFKDKEHFIEELNKSICNDIDSKAEELEKSRSTMFTHGSTIRINKATKGNGYEVHEHHENGDITNHGSVPYGKIDNRMSKDSDGKHVGLLRMKDSKHEGVPLHHTAEVKHVNVKNAGSGSEWKEERLSPAGDPHAIGSGKSNS